ncbi:MAG: His-Xaa-Ser system radical SAM maturase HxsC, partial [Clostridia bacterium]
TYRDERIAIARDRCALQVEADLEQGDDGYGAYLFTDRLPPNNSANAYQTNEPFEDGALLYLHREEGECTVRPMPILDRGERTLFVTGRCNSNCLMCPYGSKWRAAAQDEPLEILLRYIDLMDPFADYLCITGGEPTLLKDGFFQLLASSKRHFENCLVHLLTNARAFFYRDFFEAYRCARPSRILLGVPLHASHAELHDKISQADGSFLQTTVGLDRLCASGEHVELRVVVSALNIEDLSNTARLIAQRYPNVYRVCIMGLEMMGSAMFHRDKVWIPFEAARSPVGQMADILLNAGIPVQLYNFPLCYIAPNHRSLCKKSISDYKVRYRPECDVCQCREACGGFFSTTIHMPGIEVTPL